MGKTTAIQWCDSTLNLQMGCDGCELWNPKAGVKKCYAGQLHERYAGASKGYPASFDQPQIFGDRMAEAERWPDLTGTKRLDKPWLNGMPRLIFLNDMGDTFTESLPLNWLEPFLPRLAKIPAIIMLLTKRANRMLEFSRTTPFPANFWLMTSVTCEANRNRVEQLLDTRGGSAYGISYEPALEWVDFRRWLRGPRHLSFVITGGESGPGAQPYDLAWPRDLIKQCGGTECVPFVKQLGAKPTSAADKISHRGDTAPRASGFSRFLNDRSGGDWNEWPADLRVRQLPVPLGDPIAAGEVR